MGVMLAYFDDIEGYYHNIPDLMSISCRRMCNLCLHWLRVFIGDEQFQKEYRDIFYGDPSRHLARQEALKNIKPSVKGVEGSLNIEVKESKVVDDISMFLGRSTGGQAVSSTVDVKPKKRLSISPDDDGGVVVSGDSEQG